MNKLACLVVGVWLFALGCNKDGKPQGPAQGPTPSGGGGNVKIVTSLPRTGSANAQTTTIVNGIRMAIEEAGGKVGDFTISYEDWDDASAKKGDWDPEVEAANADKAVKDPDVIVLHRHLQLGRREDLDAGAQQGRPGDDLARPTPTPGLTKPGMGEPNEPDVYRPSGKVTYFRVVPADDIQGRVGAEWIKQMGGKTRLRARRPRGLRQGHRRRVQADRRARSASRCSGARASTRRRRSTSA